MRSANDVLFGFGFKIFCSSSSSRSTYEDVRLAVQIANGTTILRNVFPALTRKVGRRESKPALPPAFTVGQIVGGRWEIRQKIAEGGFAAVFEARDTKRSSAHTAVVKIAKNAGGAELLRQEYEIGTRLRHQNICVYREIHEDPPGSEVVVLDHGGRSLDRIIEDRGALPLPEVFDVTAQIAHALDYAHERNVMHQDLKPQNVLMQELALVESYHPGEAGEAGAATAQATGEAPGAAGKGQSG